LETLRQLEQPGFYEQLNRKAEKLVAGLRAVLGKSNLPNRLNAAGSLATLFFATEPVVDFMTAKRSDTARFARFFTEMLNRGMFLAPSQFEAMFVSAAHSEADIDRTIEACRDSLQAISAGA
jgi:glutamate-1-semialdehyde 2,1-aminomutase